MTVDDAQENVKVYTVNGAAAGAGSASSLPDWLTRKRASKGKGKRAIREEFEGAINLIQHFEFPEASNRIRVTKSSHHAIATGVYKPQIRVYDLDQLTLKFERHSDAENVDFTILSDDWTKTLHLQADRTVELHAQGGLHYKTRIPRFGRALAYHYPSCDALLAGAGDEVFRLNLEQGRFLAPLSLHSNAENGDILGVNAIDINPAHQLLSFAVEGPGTVEFWDPRSRSRVGVLTLPRSLASTWTSATVLPGVDAHSRTFAATALSSRSDGLSLAVGTSTGHTLLYDIRSPKPYATKDQGYGLPIHRVAWIDGGSRMAGDGLILSADKKVLKVWDRETPSSNFASVNPPTDINDVCHLPGTGLFMLANEGIHMTSYYIPQLGPAPKWCSFLDNLTEEMEEQTVRNVYEDFKFVERSELSALGLDHLIGTPALKPYMHGYFASLKLYDAARVITNPFIYAEHREKLVRAKLDKLAESRIRTRKNNLPKVNRALAERMMKADEKEARKKKRKRDDQNEATKEEKDGQNGGWLVDPRFKSIFEDPEFEVDEASREYSLMHPSQAEASARKPRVKTAVEAEEQSEQDSSEDALVGGDSSEEDDEEKSSEEDSSEEDMVTVNLHNTRPIQTPPTRKLPHNAPRMVSASAFLGTTGTASNDKATSFGQRRQRPSGAHHTTRQSGMQKAEDGGFAMSWIPSQTKDDSGKPARVGAISKIKRPGIEYLGAGLEKGVERLNNLSETERKGRSERRKNVRSGSKNVFRKV